MAAVDQPIIGPVWSGPPQSDYSGRYPLSVERHVMTSVAHLLPGVTTVTPHARYFAVHALIAAEVERLNLDVAAAQRLMRRAEVALGAITLVHGDASHPGTISPHGGERIRAGLDESGVDIAALSRPEGYAKARWGFWSPYLASGALLGLAEWRDGSIALSPRAEVGPLREGLGDLLELARKDHLSYAELASHDHLCLCAAAGSSDGSLLTRRLLPSDPSPESHGDRRSQTIRMLLRLYHLNPGADSQLWSYLAFEPQVAEDAVLAGLQITAAWTGVVLRNRMVQAWRDLWKWLVHEIGGMSYVGIVAEALAEHLPVGTVDDFVQALPEVVDPKGRLLPAELQVTSSAPMSHLETLAICARRSREGMPSPRVGAYFEHPSEVGSQLTPSWMADRLEEWRVRPARDFAAWLVSALFERSHWIALRKAGFDGRTGTYRVPTRVSVRENGQLIQYADESGGGVGLRWSQLSSVIGELGLLRRDASGWHVTEKGAAAW